MAIYAPAAKWPRLVLISLVSLVLALAWLPAAKYAGGLGTGEAVGAAVQRGEAITEAVTRLADPSSSGTTTVVTYLTPEYLAFLNRDPSEAAGASLFLMYEENHYRGLVPPDQMRPPLLRVDGGPAHEPLEFLLLTDSEHHRTWTARFAREGRENLELVLPGVPEAAPLSWDLPVSLGNPSAPQGPGENPASILVLAAGLITVLSPCLLQLTLFYLTSLAGAGLARPAPRQLLVAAAWFVVGMTAAYMTGGFLAGLVGQQLRTSSALGAWRGTITTFAGVGVVGLGLWAGATAGAPVLCRLPGKFPRLMTQWGKGSKPLGSFAAGFLFSLGCLACFGGAVFASLMLYVGATASPLEGALLLGLFSLGVAVPFLLAAGWAGKAVPFLENMQRYTPILALATSTIMIAFGLLMIADRFHWVSGLLVRWIPFLT